MKFTLALLLPAFLAAASSASAVPLEGAASGPSEQAYFGDATSQYAGYELDLSEMRLVQFENEPPRWISEFDKVCVIFVYDASISEVEICMSYISD